ncbi:tail completion protein gp17 [Sphingobium lignivorans]|uniref:DUF3168 domain-containing protein n=1 Tax=Sphingobium lignivorans TaxID=2735886 RepID=A0ABR6NJH3_9SPHN|nr:hypothetical protein [Sphingobium lignivorans]MBB5987432.1 hypothetical protein [Sphingobium lignivorans]
MADLISAIVALLKADSPVAALAGERVFGGELPPDEAKQMPRHALVVVPSGGPSLTGRSYAEHDSQRLDLFAYGATPSDAAVLLQAGALALRRARRQVRAGILLHSITVAGGFSAGRDPDAAWPRAFQSFQVLHALTEV